MLSLTLAIKLAAEAHLGQVDKAGEEYILHCLTVMDMVKPHGVSVQIVGVLHDSFEDFQGPPMNQMAFRTTVQDFFGPQIYESIAALTHEPNEPYVDYIERVALNYPARVVKIADLTHNMDPRRIPAAQIVDKDFQRWDKYRKALIRLQRR